MRLMYDNEVMDATLTAATHEANYPVSNLKDTRLSRIYQSTSGTAQYILIAGTAITASCLLIAAHDIPSGATITIQGNDIDSWGAPSFSESVTQSDDIMAHYFTSASYNYWRLYVNTAAAFIIGGLHLGAYTIAPYLDLGYAMNDNDAAIVDISAGGQAYATETYQYRTGKFSIPEFSHSQRAEMRIFWESVGLHTPFYLVKWADYLSYEPAMYCVLTAPLAWKQNKSDPNKYSMTLQMREVF